MIAGLPMYLCAENRAAHDAFWAGVRVRLREAGLKAPRLLRDDLPPEEIWAHPALVLSHICNLPYRLAFRDRVTRIAASDYPVPGCAPGYYTALFVVRDDHPAGSPEELDGATMAYNAPDSHSGWGAAALWARDRGITFLPVSRTASHANSLATVVAGTAEFATIDAWTFEVLKSIGRFEPNRVRVIGTTGPAPGMTFITRAGEDPAPYRAALDEALRALEPQHREHLGLRGFPVLPDAAYDIPLPPEPVRMAY